MSCEFVAGTEHVFPGWGCCQCRVYNGLQRKQCKKCGHEPCMPMPLPEKFGFCNECGVPDGMAHIGHTP